MGYRFLEPAKLLTISGVWYFNLQRSLIFFFLIHAPGFANPGVLWLPYVGNHPTDNTHHHGCRVHWRDGGSSSLSPDITLHFPPFFRLQGFHLIKNDEHKAQNGERVCGWEQPQQEALWFLSLSWIISGAVNHQCFGLSALSRRPSPYHISSQLGLETSLQRNLTVRPLNSQIVECLRAIILVCWDVNLNLPKNFSPPRLPSLKRPYGSSDFKLS